MAIVQIKTGFLVEFVLLLCYNSTQLM
jgi:hypothetical protein